MKEHGAKQRAIFFFLLAILFTTSCITHKREKQKSVSINKIGELHFRRSYASIQFDSTINTDSIEKSNPDLGYTSDSLLVTRLSAFGLLDSSLGLIRSLFPENATKHFELIDGKKKVSVKINRPPVHNDFGYYDLIVNSISGTDSVRLEGYYGNINRDIAYLLLDITPGGFREFILLHEYYIMNGDNSDVYIYELKNTEQ